MSFNFSIFPSSSFQRDQKKRLDEGCGRRSMSGLCRPVTVEVLCASDAAVATSCKETNIQMALKRINKVSFPFIFPPVHCAMLCGKPRHLTFLNVHCVFNEEDQGLPSTALPS